MVIDRVGVFLVVRPFFGTKVKVKYVGQFFFRRKRIRNVALVFHKES